MRKLRLEGNTVYLEETAEKYFPYIIAWRNDPLNNRYLNQPFLLDMEKQRAWYRHYCADPTQGLLVVVDKQNDVPFATMGWTDHDREARLCITGRLLVGDRRYRGKHSLCRLYVWSVWCGCLLCICRVREHDIHTLS